jgi:transcriptional regulator with GAF, ATPase, and Fis domain
MSDTKDDNSLSHLQRIMDAVRALVAGEYTSEVLHGLETDSEDMAQLARTLDAMAHTVAQRNHQLNSLKRIIPIGVALSAEKDFNRLLEAVVVEAQSVTNADAGSLYLLDHNTLKFVIVRNTSLNIAMGGTSGNEITFHPVRLYNQDGSENRANIAPYAALTHKTIFVTDAYETEGFDFSGTKSFDVKTGYRSKSFLAMPLINADNQVIGVLQLINAQDRKTGEVVPFEDDDVLELLILLATAALDGYIREESLRREIAQLKIEIDQVRRTKQVAEITDSSFFKNLQDQATQLRSKKSKGEPKS